MTTLTECQLLSLDVADFRRLLENNPGLKATITRTAEERLGVADRIGRDGTSGTGGGQPVPELRPGLSSARPGSAVTGDRTEHAPMDAQRCQRRGAARRAAPSSALALAAPRRGRPQLAVRPAAPSAWTGTGRSARSTIRSSAWTQSGRIPKVPLPEDLPEPDALALHPRGPDHAGQRLPAPVRHRASSTPQIFFRAGRGLGGGIAIDRHRLPRSSGAAEFLGAFLTYTTEGQERYRLVWRRWLHHRELPDGGVAIEERSFIGASGGYQRTLTRRFFGLGPDTRSSAESELPDEVSDGGHRAWISSLAAAPGATGS